MTSQLAAAPGIWRPLLALILASAVIMGSPGPSTISATAMGAAFGVRRSLRYVGGLIAGTMAVLLAVSIGVVALMLSAPQGARALGAVSAAYILFLAFKIATAPPLESQGRQMAAPAFLGGFLLAVANPKAYLAIGAVFAGAAPLAGDGGVDALIKTGLLGGMIVAIHLAWLLAGASLSRVLRDPVSSRVVNVALAAALVATTCVALLSCSAGESAAAVRREAMNSCARPLGAHGLGASSRSAAAARRKAAAKASSSAGGRSDTAS
jgi:threonine/homoserine/homoserine lactone efflux protein